MTVRSPAGRPGSGPADPVVILDETSTVFTRLRAKKAQPGRAVRRRQARRIRHQNVQTRRARVGKWLHGHEQTATRINPARDYKSRKAGRLRKELQ